MESTATARSTIHLLMVTVAITALATILRHTMDAHTVSLMVDTERYLKGQTCEMAVLGAEK